MALSTQRELFAQAVGLEKLSTFAAYSKVYACGELSRKTIQDRADMLAASEEVKARINVLSQRAAGTAASVAAYTLDMAMTEAEQARQLAQAKGQAAAATAAVKLKAQLAGHVIEKKEVKQTSSLDNANATTLEGIRREVEERLQRVKDAEALTGDTPAAPVVRRQIA